jgi:hypothetical protein
VLPAQDHSFDDLLRHHLKVIVRLGLFTAEQLDQGFRGERGTSL